MDQNSRFIEALISATKTKKIRWEYLEDNMDLIESDITFDSKPIADYSFLTQYEEAYFALVTMFVTVDLERIQLFVIPPTFKDIRRISNIDAETGDVTPYCDDLITLRSLIKKGFPNSEDIMEKFICDNMPF